MKNRLLPERRGAKPQIILTNLIDVILLLVFFFMITSSFAKENKKLPINLPKASAGVVIEDETLTFQMDGQGKAYHNGKVIRENDIPTRVGEFLTKSPEKAILVEADLGVDYGKVIRILDLIRTGGGVNIGLSTKPGNEKK